MAPFLDEFKTEYLKYKKEEQDWKDTLDILFQSLEMAVRSYGELIVQQDNRDKEGTIFDDHVTLLGEKKEEEKEEEEKEKGILKPKKATKKDKNELKGRYKLRKPQEGGKHKKKREVERQRGKKVKEKNKQGRKEGVRSLNDGKQDFKKQNLFRDNG